jgi:hypothetical protein
MSLAGRGRLGTDRLRRAMTGLWLVDLERAA